MDMKKLILMVLLALFLSGCTISNDMTYIEEGNAADSLNRMPIAEKMVYKEVIKKESKGELTHSNKSNPDMSLAGIYLGDSYEKVVDRLGKNYEKESIKNISGYYSEDYTILHYKGLDVLIGDDQAGVMSIKLYDSFIATPKGVQIEDKASKALLKYRGDYEELVNQHSNEKNIGWFLIEGDGLLILDFNAEDKTRFNNNVEKVTQVEKIELTRLRYFD